MLVSRIRSRIPWTQRLIGSLVCLCIVIGLFPIPTYHASPSQSAKDAAIPFPCQHRVCGCKSAQQCWKQCCCFTNREKVAWAAAHRVELPDFVVDAANREPQATVKPVVCCLRKSVSEPESDTPVFAVEAAKCHGDYWTWAVVSLWAISDCCPSVVTDSNSSLVPERESKLIPCQTSPPVPPPRLPDLVSVSV